jgi:hypothetical protein
MPTTVETTDRWCVAYMLALGIRLIRARPGLQYTAYVMDNHDGRAGQALIDWHSGDATVNARAYARTLHRVRRKQISSSEDVL